MNHGNPVTESMLNVQFISEFMGFGVFASQDIKQFTLLGEYTGELKKYDHEDTTYSWVYPSKVMQDGE